MIRVADYIAQTLASHGVRHVFLVTGGGAMHLNDAIGRCKELRYVACHHEQACAMAADSYFRLSNRLAAVNVTTGPGGINALNGVFGAYTDSLGLIVVSGQVKWETTLRAAPPGLRQLGDQEADIVSIVSPITKYAVMVEDPQSVRYHLEKALFLATHGRPGPVWLDVPMNVQGALVDPDSLPAFDASEVADTCLKGDELREVAHRILEKLKNAQRPVVFAGSGVRLSGQQNALLELAQKRGVPLVTAWNAHDLVPDSHPCYVGRPGTIGDRAGNFAVQNADVLLVLGSRLNIRQISYNWEAFAPRAFQIVVDVDEAELQKPTLAPDLPVHADLRDLLPLLLSGEVSAPREWLDWCLERRARYPVVLPEYWQGENGVNPYCFAQKLFEQLNPDEIVVTGDGTACVTTFQAAKLQPGQRLYTNSGSASMGYDLPAAVGAAFASGTERIICLAGDGSIMMNLQELQTIRTHALPVKLFVLNNRGYHSIRQTQHNYFPDNIVGCGEESGLSFPNFSQIASAFGFSYQSCARHDELDFSIRATLEAPGPTMCEVFLDLEQQFAPKLSSRKLDDGRMVSSPLEDLAPFLSRQELAKNMIGPVED